MDEDGACGWRDFRSINRVKIRIKDIQNCFVLLIFFFFCPPVFNWCVCYVRVEWCYLIMLVQLTSMSTLFLCVKVLCWCNEDVSPCFLCALIIRHLNCVLNCERLSLSLSWTCQDDGGQDCPYDFIVFIMDDFFLSFFFFFYDNIT